MRGQELLTAGADEVAVVLLRFHIPIIKAMVVDIRRIQKVTATVIQRTTWRPCILIIEISHTVMRLLHHSRHQHILAAVCLVSLTSFQRKKIAHGVVCTISRRMHIGEDSQPSFSLLTFHKWRCFETITIKTGMGSVERFTYHQHYHRSLLLFRIGIHLNIVNRLLHQCYLTVLLLHEAEWHHQLIDSILTNREG